MVEFLDFYNALSENTAEYNLDTIVNSEIVNSLDPNDDLATLYWPGITVDTYDPKTDEDIVIDGYKKFNQDVETHLQNTLDNILSMNDSPAKITDLENWIEITFEVLIKISVLSILSPKFQYDLQELKDEIRTNAGITGEPVKPLRLLAALTWRRTQNFKKTIIGGFLLLPATMIKKLIKGGIELAKLKDFVQYTKAGSRNVEKENLINQAVQAFYKDYPGLKEQLDSIKEFNKLTDATEIQNFYRESLNDLEDDNIIRFSDGLVKVLENIKESPVVSFWQRLFEFIAVMTLYVENFDDASVADGERAYTAFRRFLSPYKLREFLKTDYNLEEDNRGLNTYLAFHYLIKFLDTRDVVIFSNTRRVISNKRSPTTNGKLVSFSTRLINALTQSAFNVGSIQKIEVKEILTPYPYIINIFETIILGSTFFKWIPFNSTKVGMAIAFPVSIITTRLTLPMFRAVTESAKYFGTGYLALVLYNFIILGLPLYNLIKKINKVNEILPSKFTFALIFGLTKTALTASNYYIFKNRFYL